MIHALYTASQGMKAQQVNIDTIAHNLSNVNTTGFKKDRAEFQDLLYNYLRKPTTTQNGIAQPLGMQLGLGVRSAAIQTIFTGGNLTFTENPTDVALVGPGFFLIDVPGYDEPLYTKDGSFKIDAEGNFCTSDGYMVVGVDAFPDDAVDISISQTGLVTYKQAGQTEIIEAGQIEVARFVNPAGLIRTGHNLYQRSEASGEPQEWDPTTDGTIKLEQGYLEYSNVQVVEEMVNMITAQRAYEVNSKVIQASDEMLGQANNLRR